MFRTFRIGLFFIAAIAAADVVPNPAYSVGTLIGSGSHGDGGPALQALLNGAGGLAQDGAGNIYISESNAGVIRRVRPDGTIERFAGTGTTDDGVAGQAALRTNLLNPTVLLVDKDGGLIFADASACRIRKVRTDGILVDLAGTGRCTYNNSGRAGMGGGSGSTTTIRDSVALETDLGYIGGMVFDASGRLNFSETDRHLVRRLDSDGYVRKVAGTGSLGSTGDEYAATSATLYYPAGLAVDPSGILYIADGYNCKVRYVDKAGIIDTVIGGSTCASSTAASFAGPATTLLSRVGPMVYDAGSNSIYIALPASYRVVRYSLDTKRVSTFLGSGKLGSGDSDTPLRLTLNEPSALLPTGNLGLLVAASSSFRVYQVQGGTVSPYAGYWPQTDTYPAPLAAQLVYPTGVFAAADGTVLMTDSGAGRVMQWKDAATLAPLAGMAYPTGLISGENGVALQVTLDTPLRVVQRSNGDIYVCDNSRIRRIDAQGNIKTVLSGISTPSGIVFDPQDRLVYSEAGRHRVRRLDLTTNVVSTIVGTSDEYDFDGDGGAATSAYLYNPGDVAYDSKGNLLIADRGNHRVRVVGTDGNISTLLGSGLPFSYNDISGQKLLKTGFDIIGLAVDGKDNIYISEGLRIDRISADGKISIVTGLVSEDDNGVDTFYDGALNTTSGISVDLSGRIFVALKEQGQVIVVTPR
jgi:hypothetical protein